ncbi:MAG: hypothetical protein VX335_05060 [Pseudomonadota bacterium]|nr:hypothetical protein [Pseudomonadota bacterium]
MTNFITSFYNSYNEILLLCTSSIGITLYLRCNRPKRITFSYRNILDSYTLISASQRSFLESMVILASRFHQDKPSFVYHTETLRQARVMFINALKKYYALEKISSFVINNYAWLQNESALICIKDIILKIISDKNKNIQKIFSHDKGSKVSLIFNVEPLHSSESIQACYHESCQGELKTPDYIKKKKKVKFIWDDHWQLELKKSHTLMGLAFDEDLINIFYPDVIGIRDLRENSLFQTFNRTAMDLKQFILINSPQQENFLLETDISISFALETAINYTLNFSKYKHRVHCYYDIKLDDDQKNLENIVYLFNQALLLTSSGYNDARPGFSFKF